MAVLACVLARLTTDAGVAVADEAAAPAVSDVNAVCARPRSPACKASAIALNELERLELPNGPELANGPLSPSAAKVVKSC